MRRERFSISVFGVAPYNFTRGHSGKSSAADDRFFGVWPILACLLDHLCSQLVVAYPTPPRPLFFCAVGAILCFCTLFCFVMASLSVKYAKSTSWKMPSSHPSYFPKICFMLTLHTALKVLTMYFYNMLKPCPVHIKTCELSMNGIIITAMLLPMGKCTLCAGDMPRNITPRHKPAPPTIILNWWSNKGETGGVINDHHRKLDF